MIFKNVTAVLPEGEKVCDIRITDGKISEIGENILSCEEEIKDCTGRILMPGFIDTHIHGGLSKPFFETDLDFAPIVEYYAKKGTTALLPSFSCMPFDELETAVKKTTEFARRNCFGAKIPGFHAEGPYLNPVRCGGMNPDYMVKPDVEHYKKIEDACEGMLRLITLAPEMPGALDVTALAVSHGVAVSAGHTDATYDEMMRAIDAGLSRMTHTFNASRPISHREPGVLGAALTDSRVNCEAICDFGHLHPATVKSIYLQKGCEGFTLVSDYSDKRGLAAKGEGEHEADGKKYYIRNGVAWTMDGGVMANSNDISVGVRNLYSLNIPLKDIAVMASANPAKVSGNYDTTGSIEVGKAADLVLLDEKLNVVETYVDGKCYK